MCKLKLLVLDFVEAPILCDIPSTLKVLHWKCCPMETLPFTDQHYELVEIHLPDSKIVQLWDGKKVLKKLELLNLSCCYKLKETPDLSGAPVLKILNLEHCRELNYVHPSLALHKSLVELNLTGCYSIETLADKLEMCSLETLGLDCCTRLRRLPEFGECMKQLSILILTYTDIEEVPTTLGNLAGVSELDLTGCDKLTSLPLTGCFLKKLELHGFVELSCLPHEAPSTSKESTLYCDLGHLAQLTNLDLSDNCFIRVPISIHQLPRLTCLKLSFCDELEVLPELPSSLRELHAQGCDSLDASNVDDVISKACCGFAESASQDREDVLQMLITGEEIPGWFEHQEEDEGVSVSFPLNCPSTEMVALALCFLFERTKGYRTFTFYPSVICNGKEFINASLYVVDSSDSLLIMITILISEYRDVEHVGCASKTFKISGKQNPKQGKEKETLEWNMDMRSHSSTSRNKMLVVGPPLCDEEEKHGATAEGAIGGLASRKSSDPPELLLLFPLHSPQHLRQLDTYFLLAHMGSVKLKEWMCFLTGSDMMFGCEKHAAPRCRHEATLVESIAQHGTETIQSIVLPPIGNGTYYVESWRDKAFPNMSQLKFLNFDFVRAHIHINIPSTLKVLHWELCPLETLPLVDQRYELVEIKISWSNIVQLWHGFKFLEKLKHLDLSCSGLEQTPDLSGFPSLTDLDLSGNHFVNLPISIHELPKLKCLSLNGCKRLQSLPELPSSIRELKAWCCDSLDTRSFNNLSKACSVFASTSQGPGEVLQMVIPGTNIPSWFVHRQESNCLLVPFPHHCHPSERLGIALCFLVRPSERWFSLSLRLAVGNGDRVITNSIPIWYHQGYHLCMFCMTNDCLIDQETRKAIHFELSFEDINVEYPPEILSSAACWVHTDEIEHLNKGETERPNKKRQKMLEEKH
ncbi:hypothetical protein Ahy_B04g072190 [Arachis hypogaea]|uniref:C-JID domain-containing protein n=1 Tax=Arachis hypogaea TaxID=3818 RepID=A0A444ZMP5_ARAHY|nr:hypothetical protein Ahy_B04g072190 [Arachis hypogaea]